jgi:diguanylate cyclase (GGDEF)-like protein
MTDAPDLAVVWFATGVTGRRRRIAAWLVGVLVPLTALNVIANFTNDGSSFRPLWDGIVAHTVLLVGAVTIVLRAMWRSADRPAWIGLAVAFSAWALATLIWTIVDADAADDWHLANVPYYVGYLGVYVGLTVASRQNGPLLRSAWLDGLVAGAGITAIAAWLLISPLVRDSSASAAVLTLNVVYPVADLVAMALLLAFLAPRALRPGWSMVGVVLGLLVYTVSDVYYAYVALFDNYVLGTLIDSGWAIGTTIVAVAAWLREASATRRGIPVGGTFVPMLFGVSSLSILLAAAIIDVPGPAMLLAALALGVSLLRATMTVHEVRRLIDSHSQARIDELTGLPNRRALLERLEAELRDDVSVSVALIDLDGFKEINDSLGHDAGDELLRAVGDRIATTSTVHGFVARLGGDEFGVLMPSCPDEAFELMTQVVGRLEEPFALEVMAVRIGASIGIASSPEHGMCAVEVLKCADVAMYHAKRRHLGVNLYRPEDDPNGIERLALLEDLRGVIDNRTLGVHYQPMIEVGSGRIIGAEALARWQHPVHGAIGPDMFIELAERMGIIGRLTRCVLDQALAQIAEWRLIDPDLRISVNISATDLVDELLPVAVGEALARAGVPGSALTLEVTETSLVLDSERAQRVIRGLRQHGVRISIDDFGVGYSSMSQLLRISIDEVKIDRSFIGRLVDDERARAIVAATVEIGRSMGVSLVAEGVEDEITLQLASATGCGIVQGYYFSHPLPAAGFTTVLEAAVQRTISVPSPV